MNNSQPKILMDKTRLQEIFSLRVLAWEHSQKALYVNKEVFPNGLKDDLDDFDSTVHWIVEHKNKIIAAVRLVIWDNIEANEEDWFAQFELPKGKPFGYWSRLVVHPDFRKMGIAHLLDFAVMNFVLGSPQIAYVICNAALDRHTSILQQRFVCLGDSQYDWGHFSQPVKVYLFSNPNFLK